MSEMKNCYRCGAPGEIEIEDGSAICEACEDQFQAAMRAEYPFGQCGECGAKYQQATCEQGKVHTFAMHPEGGCSQWGDVADRDWSGEGLIARGYCSYGCAPRTDWRQRSRDVFWMTAAERNAMELPF
jgi:hydrogenase maturation factor HypF (carbamoyltransferase family)